MLIHSLQILHGLSHSFQFTIKGWWSGIFKPFGSLINLV